MAFTAKDDDIILSMYKEGKSTYEIADKLNTYSNKIRRRLKKLGVALRSKSEAQKNALAEGRHKHPTKGRKRTKEEKDKISTTVANYWENMEDEERERRSEMSKEQWDKMSDDEKEALQRAASEGVRRTSKEGSKMELFLKKELKNSGFEVIFHKTGLVTNSKLEVDLFVPELRTVIEIDGPAHFLPIWGEDTLQKTIKSDAEKSGLLLSNGFIIIRVKQLIKNVSGKHQRETLKVVLEELRKIKKKKPKQGKLIEVEVK